MGLNFNKLYKGENLLKFVSKTRPVTKLSAKNIAFLKTLGLKPKLDYGYSKH